MSISEYEYFGVVHNENAKDSRGTVGEGVPTVGQQEEETSTEERFIDVANQTEIKSVALCALALLAGCIFVCFDMIYKACRLYTQ